ncbi:hydrogen gas-evolving membrane-bound hydrogenase subunit E [Candidatus Margulisiibacteriota bacterium]
MNRVLPLIILIILAVIIFSAVKIDYGYPKTGVSQYFLGHGVSDTGALNMVTAIYLDYRAFDTLGEATVFFAAALGVFMLLKKRGEGEKD